MHKKGMGNILVISTGPGSERHITPLAQIKAGECDVIIGNSDQLAALKTTPEQKVYEESSIEEILNLIERYKDDKVGVLIIGDAGIYSLSQKIIQRFGKDAVQEIVPGVSSIQVAFARIKEPWLDMSVFSYHGKSLDGVENILKNEKVAILCDKENTSKVILTALEKYGLFDKDRKTYVCQDLTFKNERIIEINNPVDIKNLTPKRREIILMIG